MFVVSCCCCIQKHLTWPTCGLDFSHMQWAYSVFTEEDYCLEYKNIAISRSEQHRSLYLKFASVILFSEGEIPLV